jgi:hypothetical protein
VKKLAAILIAALLMFSAFAGCSSRASGVSSQAVAKTAAGDSALMAMQEKESTTAESVSSGSQTDASDGTKLIYTATVSLETTEFSSAVEKLSKLVSDLGGYIQQSSLNNYETYRTASYTVRIPSEKYRSFCDQLSGVCQVDSFSENVQDISDTYYDAQSRLGTERTKLRRLQELLAQAKDMTDIITLEKAISEAEQTIESLEGTLRKYDSLVSNSTVNLSLREVSQLSGTNQPAIGFGAKLQAALQSGCERGIGGIQGFLLAVAYNWVGWLIFLAALAVLILLLRRRRQRKEAEAAKAYQHTETQSAAPGKTEEKTPQNKIPPTP